jgi:hypothetical protein
MKTRLIKNITEEQEWLRLSPAERMIETGKLWRFYLSLGGILDREPDPQSPFYIPEIRRQKPAYRRPGVHNLRRRRI